jgi:ABC-type transport system involved in cytochrome c biogenesis permease subunit
MKNDLAVRANVKVIANIKDPAVQSVWLHSHHSIGSATQGATLGAFVLGGIYWEWTPLLNRKESKLRLGLLLTQISKAAEHRSRVVFHGDFNINLDLEEDKGYYMAAMLTSLAECTSTAGLETHVTLPTFRSFGNFLQRGDAPSPAGDLQSPT